VTEPTRPPRWYESRAVILIASVLVPPVGFGLLWAKRDLKLLAKLAGSFLILVLSAGYYHYGKRALNSAEQARRAEIRYSALEQQRAEQGRRFEQAAARVAAPLADYWTDFRGPRRDGDYEEMAVNTDWTRGLRQVWKQPVGAGFASFVIGGGRAYTIEQRRGQEVATAYDVGTGRELWTNGWDAEFREALGGDGPRATPTYHDGRVYALGAEGEFRCLDAATGATIWRKNILTDAGASNLTWGMAASPLIVDDKVIVQPGGSHGNSVVAYDKTTGAPVWKALDDEASYTSPMLVTLAGRRQILTVTATRAIGLAPENGALLWEYAWSNSSHISVAQPVLVGDHRVFLSASYGAGAAVFDVSVAGARFTTRPVWANSLMKNRFQTSVLLDGYVYGLDEGILTCLDVNTGERKWKGGRYGYGQVTLAGHSLIVFTEASELVLVEATPGRFNEVARMQALEGPSRNVPAIANGTLLVRNATDIAAYDLRK
jgi:outer membrane protein assembly factor BamB